LTEEHTDQSIPPVKMATPAASPPPGYTSDLLHPKDEIRTINMATQALTLAFCSVFVWIRGYHKYKTIGLDFAVDDCKCAPTYLE
jgi:hypothetical protein